MVDANHLAKEWIAGMNANQNTRAYGLVSDTDGVWRDENGNVEESSGVKSLGPFGAVKSIAGAVARISKKGGF